MERQITIVRKTKAAAEDPAAARRERRVQVVSQAGACVIACDDDCATGCCAGDACCGGQTDCLCLCGCKNAEITETEEDGHTVIKIRLPKAVRETGEDDALVKAAGVSDAVENLGVEIGVLVRRARAQGSSWTDIGAALGISKQAAWERFSGEE